MSCPKTLYTSSENVVLVEPNRKRDAQLGVRWINESDGYETLRLMGVAPHHNTPTTLRAEEERVQGFITQQDHYNWMIQYKGTVVGSVWVDLIPKETVQSPSVHIMIGDPQVRRKGVGTLALQAVIDYLRVERNATYIYSRHLTENTTMSHVFEKLSFINDGTPYTDSNGLVWQNVQLHVM